jgi:hypothetical protein
MKRIFILLLRVSILGIFSFVAFATSFFGRAHPSSTLKTGDSLITAFGPEYASADFASDGAGTGGDCGVDGGDGGDDC